MKYVLFVGSRVGFEGLKTLSMEGCHISCVFIEKEHSHEIEKYCDKSRQFCLDRNISHSIIENQFSGIPSELGDFDYLLCFGLRRMLPKSQLEKPKYGALGTHFSPLPRYRGFAPINWVLINGEKETAVNLFYLSDTVDSGDIIAQKTVSIDYSDDANTLLEKCIRSFIALLQESIPLLESKTINVIKQNEDNATYCCARNPSDGKIDWSKNSRDVYNLVRGITNPFPGAYTFFKDQKLIIWSCEEYAVPFYEGIIPGKVIKIIDGQGVVILCANGAVLLRMVQLEGKGRQSADMIIKSIRDTLV